MATLIRCDICKQIRNPTIQVEVQEESPHNGDIFWIERDVCLDCLRSASEIKVSFGGAS